MAARRAEALGPDLTVPNAPGANLWSPRLNDQLMSVPEVAEYLGIRESWIYDNWRNEAIPFFRIGNQLRARRAELDDWLTSQRAS